MLLAGHMVEDISRIVLNADVKCAENTGQQFEASILVSTHAGRILKVPVEIFWIQLDCDEIGRRLQNAAEPEDDALNGPHWGWVVMPARQHLLNRADIL